MMTRVDILDAAAEILALESFENDDLDEMATLTVQHLGKLQDKINFPNAQYEKWVD